MATLHVRNVPDPIYEELRKRAQAEGRSLSGEVIAVLQLGLRHSTRSQEEILETITSRHRYRPRDRGAPSSTELLRQDRSR